MTSRRDDRCRRRLIAAADILGLDVPAPQETSPNQIHWFGNFLANLYHRRDTLAQLHDVSPCRSSTCGNQLGKRSRFGVFLGWVVEVEIGTTWSLPPNSKASTELSFRRAHLRRRGRLGGLPVRVV